MTHDPTRIRYVSRLQALREGKTLNGKDGILTPFIKKLTEAAMQAELEQHLEDEDKPRSHLKNQLVRFRQGKKLMRSGVYSSK